MTKTATFALLSFLFTLGCGSPNSSPTAVAQNQSGLYEYIIVGSGAGGGTLAARLAVNGKKVLLIEAGDDQGSNINQTVPVFHAYSTEDESMRWDFFVKHYQNPEEAKQDSKMTWVTPQGKEYIGKSPPTGSTMKGILYPRTGTLGGCTAHNAMVAVYPHASDWQHIVNITGDKSWEPAEMRKLYTRLERNEYATAGTTGTAGHGFAGNLSTSLPPITLAGEDTRLFTFGTTTAKVISNGDFDEELANIGRITGGDMNSADAKRDNTTGTWLIPLTVRHDDDPKKVGRRVGSRELVLDVYNAKNKDGSKKYQLDIALNTFTTKVVFDKTSPGTKPKAIGVEVVKKSSVYRADPRAASGSSPLPKTETLLVSKEVILAGGAFNTPQLLKLSGIGPKAELARFRIPLKVDLPGVGTNMQDHFEIGVTHEAATPFDIVKKCTYGKAGDPCLEEWKNGTGVYGSSNGFVYGVIMRSSVSKKDVVYRNDPDLFLFGGLAYFRGYYPGYSNDVYQHNHWTWVILRAHTGNRAGTVKLISADPRDPPEISFNYFDKADGAGKDDMTAMSEAVDMARKITMNVTNPGDNLNFKELSPGIDKKPGSQALEQHIKAESWSHHASCTCPIGSDNDKMAVLDSKFRVRGVEGLRVVDASAFPRIPGFFIAIPTYMLGEKAADTITSGS